MSVTLLFETQPGRIWATEQVVTLLGDLKDEIVCDSIGEQELAKNWKNRQLYDIRRKGEKKVKISYKKPSTKKEATTNNNEIDEIIQILSKKNYEFHIEKFTLLDALKNASGLLNGYNGNYHTICNFFLSVVPKLSDDEDYVRLVKQQGYLELEKKYPMEIFQTIISECVALGVMERNSWVTDMYSGTEYYISKFGNKIIKELIKRTL